MADFFSRNLSSFSRCWLVDPILWTRGDDRLDDDPACVPQLDAEACIAAFVGLAPNVRSLIVEDEYAVRGDRIRQKHFLVGSRVLRWTNVEDGLLEAARILRPSSGGVPLLGYMVERRPEDVGITSGRTVTAPEVTSLIQAVYGLLVPLSDSEAQVAICRHSEQSVFDDLPTFEGDPI